MPNYKTNLNTKDAIEQYTNVRFKKAGVNYMAKCPFHDDRNESMSYNTEKNKVHCFACDFDYDAVDFLTRYLNKEVDEVKDILGIPISEQYKITKSEKGKIISFAEDCIKKYKNYKGWSIKDIYRFTNIDGSTHHFVVKFIDNDGNKQPRPFRIEADTNKVLCNLEGMEPKHVPYNLYRLANNNNSDNPKPIFILEGEKDADTISKYGFLVTSMKGYRGDVEAIEELFKDKDIYIIGDTGEAGKKYIEEWKEHYFNIANSIHVVKLPGLEAMGDNKDVTDWIEAGHTKEELEQAIYRSLDLKNKNELQQDKYGIYKEIAQYDKKTEEFLGYKRINITDFQITNATIITLNSTGEEAVKLELISKMGKKYSRQGLSTVFDDVKSFRNFIGSMDLTFLGNAKNLTELKIWVNRYFALENEELYEATTFEPIKGKLALVTTDGAYCKDGVINSVKSEKGISLKNINSITSKEMNELFQRIFMFNKKNKVITIIGTAINNLAIYQAKENKIRLHHLLIIGEAGAGKSFILKNVLAPLLNINRNDIKAMGKVTPFAMEKDISNGNYTTLYDEFKPSRWNEYKINQISELLRNLYDNNVIVKGNKSLKTTEFQLSRPIIMVGEEGYPSNETALLERSAIVYLSTSERNEKNDKAGEWLVEHEILLNRFGKSLIDYILLLSVEDYAKIRKRVESKFTSLKDRVKDTAVNIATGIEIFKNVALEIGVDERLINLLTGYEKSIIDNLKEEVLNNNERTASTIEQILLKFDEMLGDGSISYKDIYIQYKYESIWINTSKMIDTISKHIKEIGISDIKLLSKADFKKQSIKAKYLIENSTKRMRYGDDYKDNKKAYYDEYSIEKLAKLNCLSILDIIKEIEVNEKGVIRPKEFQKNNDCIDDLVEITDPDMPF